MPRNREHVPVPYLASGHGVCGELDNREATGPAMSGATLDYLLALAIREREKHAWRMIETGAEQSKEWGEAALVVKELLELRQRAA